MRRSDSRDQRGLEPRAFDRGGRLDPSIFAQRGTVAMAKRMSSLRKVCNGEWITAVSALGVLERKLNSRYVR
jgi:hypothetical protein